MESEDVRVLLVPGWRRVWTVGQIVAVGVDLELARRRPLGDDPVRRYEGHSGHRDARVRNVAPRASGLVCPAPS